MARDMSTYFSRIYPVASGDQDVDVQYLAITHTGLKLVKREKSLPTDFLSVVEFYSFEDIAEVATIKSSNLQIVMRTGGRVVLTTAKAASVRDLINQFIIEARSGEFGYARASWWRWWLGPESLSTRGCWLTSARARRTRCSCARASWWRWWRATMSTRGAGGSTASGTASTASSPQTTSPSYLRAQ